MPDRVFNLHAPAGGVVRSLAYQNQQPYTTPAALNVWPEDTLLGRQRVGQRPGMVNTFTGVTVTPSNHLGVYRYTDATLKWKEYMMASQYGSAIWESSGGFANHTSGTAAGLRVGAINGRQRGQLYFFSDHSYNPEETSSAVVAFGEDGALSGTGTTFDSASYSDWTSLVTGGATELQYDFQVVLLNGTNVRVGCYPITTATSGNLTLTTNPMITGSSASSIRFRLERCPKYISSASGNTTLGGTTINKWVTSSIATYGYVPSGNHLLEVYRDRCVLAGGIENPRQWYMSAIGDPFDWNYAATGDGRACTGATQGQKAGGAGDPITALLAYNDETMWMGCSNSIYIFRGDPTFGGSLDLVSTHVGCISQYAVCRTSDAKDGGHILWMSQDGMYGMLEGAIAKVVPISRDKLPAELRNLNPQTHRIVLQWDHANNGVYVFVTHKTTGTGTGHWFLDWANKGWWPMSFHTDCEPWCAAVAPFYATASKSAVVMGCPDGWFRQFDSSRGTDQRNATVANITSYYDIGPIALGKGVGQVGALTSIEGAPSASSGDVDWSIRTGDTAEQAYNASVLAAGANGEWNSTGLQPKQRPRIRGHSAFVRISNGETGTGARWSMEDIQVGVTHGGERRVG
jgi:hypothetical protein